MSTRTRSSSRNKSVGGTAAVPSSTSTATNNATIAKSPSSSGAVLPQATTVIKQPVPIVAAVPTPRRTSKRTIKKRSQPEFINYNSDNEDDVSAQEDRDDDEQQQSSEYNDYSDDDDDNDESHRRSHNKKHKQKFVMLPKRKKIQHYRNVPPPSNIISINHTTKTITQQKHRISCSKVDLRNKRIDPVHGGRLCSHPKCPRQVQQGGVCCKHGAKTTRALCRADDCTNVAKRG